METRRPIVGSEWLNLGANWRLERFLLTEPTSIPKDDGGEMRFSKSGKVVLLPGEIV